MVPIAFGQLAFMDLARTYLPLTLLGVVQVSVGLSFLLLPAVATAVYAVILIGLRNRRANQLRRRRESGNGHESGAQKNSFDNSRKSI